ncbi:bifunctional cytochrome P450/NADPH--P450 reductase [Aquimarina sp. RZ0]|uniref:bifunctional cytochrome P450/NADPH--P450 reductase n=1 Tax=Aquimarina sp. RZ0 TaxID=2607730 RepID=UPI0011F0E224|nr:bifunctional cytochrome P450/NADPH--P450 reductase [Aquimarina sp. RZ0]KAA1242951.1 cytochrome P450 [Aquimarina sp. RZ0]
MKNNIPHPPRKPIIGNLHQILGKEPIKRLSKFSEQYGPIFEMKVLKNHLLFTGDPSIINELSDDKLFYKKIVGGTETLRKLAGDGLFTAYDQEPNWEKAHNILLPGFGSSAMKSYFPAMLEITNQLIKKWEQTAKNESPLCVPEDMTRLTLDVIGLCGFDYRFNSFKRENPHPFINHMNVCLEEISASIYRLPIINKLNFSAKKRLRGSIIALNKIVDNVITKRKSNRDKEQKSDFLSLMLKGKDKLTGEKLSDENIRYQIITLLIAGHETTGGLLSFALYYILKNPEVLRKAVKEVNSVLGTDPSINPKYEDIIKLKYLNQILKETLRLQPTVPSYRVAPYKDVVLGGKFKVKKDQSILVLNTSLHRHPEVWGDNAGLFDPENFSEENERKRSSNCYKPFGSGMRACLGSQFASIEAQLVLAMIIRRFKLINYKNYNLKVKAGLTLRPEDFFIKLKLKENKEPIKQETQKNSNVPIPKIIIKNKQEYHGTPLRILFGSEMGLSENLATRLLDDALQKGFDAQATYLDNWKEKIPKKGIVVIICSTYNGNPPNNASIFFESITSKKHDFGGVSYAVFGCGNKDWNTFQKVPRTIHQKFLEFGANKILDLEECDVSSGYESQYKNWSEKFWLAIYQKKSSIDIEEKEVEKKIKITTINKNSTANYSMTHKHSKTIALSVKAVEELQKIELSKRSTKHIEFLLPENASYQIGDYLAIYPKNSDRLVNKVLDHFHLDGNKIIKLEKLSPFTTTLPIDSPIKISDLLMNYIELEDVATSKQINLLEKHTKCPPEKERLKELLLNESEKFEDYIVKGKRSFLDLLEEFPASEISFEQFILLMPSIRPRYYSISSAPSIKKNSLSITASLNNKFTENEKSELKGTCSNYLSQLKKNHQVKAFIEKNNIFQSPINFQSPIIMIANGTGLAPFRGVIQNRMYLKNMGKKLGKAYLFFGIKNTDYDFLYKEELRKYEEIGIVKIIPAFSMPNQGEKEYIQNKIKEYANEIIEVIQMKGKIYVCGDGKRMEPNVRSTINEIIKFSKLRDSFSPEYINKLIANKQYLLDVWT